MTPYESSHSDAALLALVAKIASALHPADPIRLTQAEFDASKPADCPGAKQISRRTKLPWKRVGATSLPGGSSTHVVAIRRRARQGSDLTVRRAADSLRIVAAELGPETVRPDEYEQARNRLVAKKRGIARERLEARLLTHGQIGKIGWDEALAAAGLAPRVRTPRAPQATMADIVEVFLEERGYLPTGDQMRRFCQE